MNTRCLAWLYLFCFSLSSGLAQQNRQITLDVVVTDKSGKPVAGLQQQDFTLLDNKEPNKILSFNAVPVEPRLPIRPSKSRCWWIK